jgi:anti-sigma B factor antagonist
MASTTPKILRLSSEETRSATVLRVAGEVDLLSAPSLREHLARLITDARGRSVIVDCSAVEYLDMMGVRVLEECHTRAAREGLRFVLVGSGRLVHRILTIVQLDRRIPIVDTMEDAVRTLAQAE